MSYTKESQALTINEQQELLPLVVQGESVFIDAQLLHRKLKSKTRFADWIAYRIREYGFEEGKDYFTEKISKIGMGRKASNYMLTLDMGKELGMLERNELGRAIRRYFIAKEKELRGTSQLPNVQGLFKGLKVERINNRKLYHYRDVLARFGYSTTNGSCSGRVVRYSNHFVKMGNTQYITEEYALHLYHSKQVNNNRATLKVMQPVLALNFGEGSI